MGYHLIPLKWVCGPLSHGALKKFMRIVALYDKLLVQSSSVFLMRSSPYVPHSFLSKFGSPPYFLQNVWLTSNPQNRIRRKPKPRSRLRSKSHRPWYNASRRKCRWPSNPQKAWEPWLISSSWDIKTQQKMNVIQKRWEFNQQKWDVKYESWDLSTKTGFGDIFRWC